MNITYQVLPEDKMEAISLLKEIESLEKTLYQKKERFTEIAKPKEE